MMSIPDYYRKNPEDKSQTNYATFDSAFSLHEQCWKKICIYHVLYSVEKQFLYGSFCALSSPNGLGDYMTTEGVEKSVKLRYITAKVKAKE